MVTQGDRPGKVVHTNRMPTVAVAVAVVLVEGAPRQPIATTRLGPFAGDGRLENLYPPGTAALIDLGVLRDRVLCRGDDRACVVASFDAARLVE